MSVVLYHHPFTRAASVVAMLEAVDVPYTLSYVDLAAGSHKGEEYLALNPMGKLPALVDGAAFVTETAAIGLYLADRYAPGRLAPALDDPARGTYLRWILFSPSVVEPAAAANAGKWEVNPRSIGWGTYPSMLSTLEGAIGEGPWLLGDRFSMADLVVGSTMRFLLRFGMLEARPTFTAYVERLGAVPAVAAGDAINARVIVERGLQRG